MSKTQKQSTGPSAGQAKEQLLDTLGNIKEQYIQEYLEQDQSTASQKAKGTDPSRPRRLRLTLPLAAAIAALVGTVSFAAVPVIGHFLANQIHEDKAIIQNFEEIKAQYAIPIQDTQVCNNVAGTLNNVILEDHNLILDYTFNWSGLDEAQDGSFHTWFLPWFFYLWEGDTLLCQSEYTDGLHTQIYPDDPQDGLQEMHLLHCVNLETISGEDLDGKDLVGKELTIQLLYSRDGEGFTSTFVPDTCYTGRSWQINRTYEFGSHQILLEEVRESALYITLYIHRSNLRDDNGPFSFALSDEQGNDYTVYPYDNDINGYYFTKPDTMGTKLILKVIRSLKQQTTTGVTIDDSYEILYEIPIELAE